MINYENIVNEIHSRPFLRSEANEYCEIHVFKSQKGEKQSMKDKKDKNFLYLDQESLDDIKPKDSEFVMIAPLVTNPFKGIENANQE